MWWGWKRSRTLVVLDGGDDHVVVRGVRSRLLSRGLLGDGLLGGRGLLGGAGGCGLGGHCGWDWWREKTQKKEARERTERRRVCLCGLRFLKK